MGDPNAILAINSLDRYISNITNVNSSFLCFWFNDSTEIYYGSYGITPTLGAVVTSVGTGWPEGVITIVAISPIATSFIISSRTTAFCDPPAFVTQTAAVTSANQPISNALEATYSDIAPYSNNFTIQSPGALIYGYINRIIVSQIQIQYNIPTVCVNLNDTFYIYSTHTTPSNVLVAVTIPYGFYYPDELAATLQIKINEIPLLQSLFINVVFNPRDGFVFTSANSIAFCFPTPELLRTRINQSEINNVLKCYRLLGVTIRNSENNQAIQQISSDYPIFLYTPYIDIYSDILTNYQTIKDTNTSVAKPKGLVARVFLSSTGGIEATGSTTAIGTAPFIMTADLNNPKVIRWSPDVAVPSIDFQLLDQYGDLIPGSTNPKTGESLGFSTEFQMTLLCVER